MGEFINKQYFLWITKNLWLLNNRRIFYKIQKLQVNLETQILNYSVFKKIFPIKELLTIFR